MELAQLSAETTAPSPAPSPGPPLAGDLALLVSSYSLC